jgi:hypothetical protein
MSCPGVPVPVQDMSTGTVSTGKEAPSWFRSRRRAAGDLLSGGDFWFGQGRSLSLVRRFHSWGRSIRFG